jgi:hypothetical protein
MGDFSALHSSAPSSSWQLPPLERLRGKLDLVAMLIALKGCGQWMYDGQPGSNSSRSDSRHYFRLADKPHRTSFSRFPEARFWIFLNCRPIRNGKQKKD